MRNRRLGRVNNEETKDHHADDAIQNFNKVSSIVFAIVFPSSTIFVYYLFIIKRVVVWIPASPVTC